MSQGNFVVATGPKTIQHPTGGIVRELLVSEGDHVTAGQTLVVLDRVVTDAQAHAVASSLVQKQARLDRLIAERDGVDTLTFSHVQPPVLRGHTEFEDFLEVERRQFDSRREDRNGQRRQLLQRVSQAEEEIAGDAAQLDAVTREAMRPTNAEPVEVERTGKEVLGCWSIGWR
ncbi:biotin/lipoyl-binding protein [Aureimonas sp. Leaf454]|uniref:biotin/lipoyl-binding protein n=1 Tax=Aureimonas sp. Leaf454 TaxID=1736381 RepID=UPI00138F36D2|nr:biotin/lipoyl-binding protein [Aureimonas sp. Leaf454]